MTELENQQQLAQGALQSAEVEKLQADISALENQLVEKNKVSGSNVLLNSYLFNVQKIILYRIEKGA